MQTHVIQKRKPGKLTYFLLASYNHSTMHNCGVDCCADDYNYLQNGENVHELAINFIDLIVLKLFVEPNFIIIDCSLEKTTIDTP